MILYKENEILVCSIKSLSVVNIWIKKGKYLLFANDVIKNSNYVSCIQRINESLFIYSDSEGIYVCDHNLKK